MAATIFIGNEWRQSDDGSTIDAINPATEERVDCLSAATAHDVDLAVDCARRTFEGDWRGTSGPERARLLRLIAGSLSKRREELARLEVVDNGKPLAEALWDIDDAAGCFSFYADLADEFDAGQDEKIALPDDRFESVVRREPVGVAAQIIPWNYPLLMAAWKVAPAIAAGCTMVLKPSELTSLTCLKLADITVDAGLPPGVLNIVTGLGPVAGERLARHPGVDKIAFTGSAPTGTRIMTAAAQEIKNVSLELGGKSPFVVFDDADIDAAVEWIMFGIFWNQGQVCSATSRLIVQDGIAKRLIERLVERARSIPIGDGLDRRSRLGPLISRAHLDKVRRFISEGVAAGAHLVTGGKAPPGLSRGYFIEPTVFTDVPQESSIWREEIFGPVLAVRTYSNEAEAIKLANDTRFGLAAAVMSEDEQRCRRVAEAFRAGIVWINCSQPTFTQAPWGGFRQSGIGRELGRWGLSNYLEVKQITRFGRGHVWDWYASNPADAAAHS
jgi:betaine-aldehyde dehydrogenase